MRRRAAAAQGWPVLGLILRPQVRQVCVDMVERLPELAHIDLSRVAISVSQARKAGAYGVHASLTPMRFAGGRPVEKRRGRYYKSQVLRDASGREMLYILTFCLPRFMDVDFREKLTTIVHELWHISPEFDGDIRRHEGRCYAHTGSKGNYDREMEKLVDRWLALQPPAVALSVPAVQFRAVAAFYGRVYGVRYGRPQLLPISADEARRIERERVPSPGATCTDGAPTDGARNRRAPTDVKPSPEPDVSQALLAESVRRVAWPVHTAPGCGGIFLRGGEFKLRDRPRQLLPGRRITILTVPGRADTVRSLRAQSAGMAELADALG